MCVVCCGGPNVVDTFSPFFNIQGWFLTDFKSAISIALIYVTFVLVGSAIMKLSFIPPMSLYPIQFIYNVSQIFLCAYMTIEAGMIGYRNQYTFFLPCNPFNAAAAPTANLLWLFYISKVWDFWDTIFIIMNKKWRQLSFLHVYHHTTIFLFYWLNSNVNYDGDIFVTILLNGFIHTVMYTYYCTYYKDVTIVCLDVIYILTDSSYSRCCIFNSYLYAYQGARDG